MIENFVSLAFPGEVAAVNPNYPDVLGIPCYPTLADVPFVPDAVVVGVNRTQVIPVLEQAAAVGSRAAVIFATGLAEAAGGDQGAAEQRLRDVASATGMAVVGPNCQGTINFLQPSALYMRPVQPYDPGRIALVSQSGSITTALANNRRGVRWSHVISTGNEAVTGVEEILGQLIDDPQVDGIVAFLETIRRPEQFFAECDRACLAGKPIAVLKSGRSEAAAQAAIAHSGALAIADRVIDALFRRHRVIRALSLDELLNIALLIATGKRPAADGVGAVTGSGGEIELLLDEAGEHGLRLPELSAPQVARLRELLPEELPPVNPLDSSDVDRKRFVANHPLVLDAVQSDPQIGALVVTMSFGPTPTGRPNPGGFKMDALKELAAESDKLLCMVDVVGGTPDPELVEDMARNRVAVMSGLADSARALRGVLDFCRPSRLPAAHPPLDVAAIDIALGALGTGAASGRPALDLLTAMGLDVARTHVVVSVDEALAAARELGYPVVVKLGDPRLLHKTDVGGVVTGIGDEHALRQVLARLHERHGQVPLLLQPHIRARIELFLGIQRHPTFGSLVLVGAGGIWTEVLDDVVMRPAGLLEGEAEEMLQGLRAWPAMAGGRGGTRIATDRVIDAILRIDRTALEMGARIESLDVNPLMVDRDVAIASDGLVSSGPLSTALGSRRSG
jgi:acyl-CoA synthetase (NDP forming)